MNTDELFFSRGQTAERTFSNLPTRARVDKSYSAFKTPHFVNNGALRLSATNTHHNLEEDSQPQINIGGEVRALRNAFNLPTDVLSNSGLTSLSNHWLHQHRGRHGVGHLTDSGYSSNIYPHSMDAVHNGAASDYSTLGLDNEPAYEGKNNLSFSSHEMNSSIGSPLNSSSFYERSLKSSLDESETKRMLLLEKLREAHLTIQNQAEKLAEGESEICFLRGQLKSIGIQQEGLQQEVDCLTMERKTLEFFKSESLKNREQFLIRVNDLEKALKVLTLTHNTLQTEAEKKETALEKMRHFVTTLQQDNYELQEVNGGLTKELSSLRSKVEQQTSYKSVGISKKLEHLNKDYQKIIQEQAVVKHQLSESMKATKIAKSIQEKLNQEIVQLRMERDIQCGKVIVLEEEIQHQQQSYNNLVKEQERLLKDKAEQDQRLQREIRDRLCLKMVNDLLKEESAHVKEAFQKLEEFTSSLEQGSTDTRLQEESLAHSIEEAESFKSCNGDLLSKVANAKSHCDELESQLSSLHEANRTLKMEKEGTERQLQLIKMRENAFANQVSKSKELISENDSLKLSLNAISQSNEELKNQLNYQKEEMKTLKEKLEGFSSPVTECDKGGSINFLQEEVDKIKVTVSRLESEKSKLISEVRMLHQEQENWTLQKSELEMSLAELSAENNQLRNELQQAKLMANDPEHNTADFKKKVELEKEEAVRKAKEDLKESFDEVCLELKTVKSELRKVWDMLGEKEKEYDNLSQELQHEKEQSQKWIDELMQIRKDYAEVTTKTASRSQMICTLRDELMHRCQEISKLETALSSVNQQKCKTLEKTSHQRRNFKSKRRRSEGDISKIHGWSSVNFHNENNEIKMLTVMNTQLIQRVEELKTERNSALQDSEDLINGMQQLKEAFEEEMERELEQERANFKKEKQLLQNTKGIKDHEQLFGTKSKLETKVTILTEEKIALEVKSKNLECERDELRNQVEELCKMRTAAEEKAVQVDPALSPRKRENKTTLRKRSKSVDVTASTNMTIQEIPAESRLPYIKDAQKQRMTTQ